MTESDGEISENPFVFLLNTRGLRSNGSLIRATELLFCLRGNSRLGRDFLKCSSRVKTEQIVRPIKGFRSEFETRKWISGNFVRFQSRSRIVCVGYEIRFGREVSVGSGTIRQFYQINFISDTLNVPSRPWARCTWVPCARSCVNHDPIDIQGGSESF